jgi:nucleoid DNA-binding protein
MTLTKRDLVIRITKELKDREDVSETIPAPQLDESGVDHRRERQKIGQQLVLEVIQKTLDYISEALAQGHKVELRNFGVFEVKVRKARVGRNPNAPETDVPIPERSVVKFKPGKTMRAEVVKVVPRPDNDQKTPEGETQDI